MMFIIRLAAEALALQEEAHKSLRKSENQSVSPSSFDYGVDSVQLEVNSKGGDSPEVTVDTQLAGDKVSNGLVGLHKLAIDIGNKPVKNNPKKNSSILFDMLSGRENIHTACLRSQLFLLACKHPKGLKTYKDGVVCLRRRKPTKPIKCVPTLEEFTVTNQHTVKLNTHKPLSQSDSITKCLKDQRRGKTQLHVRLEKANRKCIRPSSLVRSGYLGGMSPVAKPKRVVCRSYDNFDSRNERMCQISWKPLNEDNFLPNLDQPLDLSSSTKSFKYKSTFLKSNIRSTTIHGKRSRVNAHTGTRQQIILSPVIGKGPGPASNSAEYRLKAHLLSNSLEKRLYATVPTSTITPESRTTIPNMMDILTSPFCVASALSAAAALWNSSEMNNKSLDTRIPSVSTHLVSASEVASHVKSANVNSLLTAERCRPLVHSVEYPHVPSLDVDAISQRVQTQRLPHIRNLNKAERLSSHSVLEVDNRRGETVPQLTSERWTSTPNSNLQPLVSVYYSNRKNGPQNEKLHSLTPNSLSDLIFHQLFNAPLSNRFTVPKPALVSTSSLPAQNYPTPSKPEYATSDLEADVLKQSKQFIQSKMQSWIFRLVRLVKQPEEALITCLSQLQLFYNESGQERSIEYSRQSVLRCLTTTLLRLIGHSLAERLNMLKGRWHQLTMICAMEDQVNISQFLRARLKERFTVKPTANGCYPNEEQIQHEKCVEEMEGVHEVFGRIHLDSFLFPLLGVDILLNQETAPHHMTKVLHQETECVILDYLDTCTGPQTMISRASNRDRASTILSTALKQLHRLTRLPLKELLCDLIQEPIEDILTKAIMS
ncbi:hypothetical protein EG68_02246 [Paragonimus skrjabini miyazakii]|uniref:Uncharacterized protein n=1 Tax=Paragonimus skrjabini miyazakii TaxID=59628 RepID=A0A8S9YZ53_9TREM|nr:hypothetical protein EG68_02246 [Paragonimus skrjabini miyazakii]